MTPSNESTSQESETVAATAEAPGAVPLTGGVPPQDAPGADGTRQRSASDDLADGIELMLRAARKALHSVDPQLEAAAERALARLQRLDADSSAAFKERTGIDAKQVEKLAVDAGREIASVVERITSRVEAVLGRSDR